MKKIQVGILMGSDSDLVVMQEAATVLDQLLVSHEVTIISAHRTPDLLFAYPEQAMARGICIIIAGAGGAAHLPGMTATLTVLPVIGVPILAKTMHGLDSLLSIVQMPPGVPVATVGINAAKNAGLLAAQILATSDPDLRDRLVVYKKAMGDEVKIKGKKLKKIGPMRYLEQMKKNG